jgi:hypothetical protein
MSFAGKFFFGLFILFALGAAAHDIYIWQTSNGFPFNFAALGWITKTYLPDEHQILVDSLGAESFNAVLTPILKIPAFFLCAGIALLIFCLDFIIRIAKNANPARGKDRTQNIKRYK